MKRLSLSIVLFFMIMLPAHLLAQDAPLKVVTTTTLIADVARNVGGDLVDVTALVPVNSDVHAFQAAPQDAVLIGEAQLVLVNGANLEETLLNLVVNAASVDLTVVSNGVPVLAFADPAGPAALATDSHEPVGRLGVDAECGSEDEQAEADQTQEGSDAQPHGACDPHVWLNPENVAIWADNIAAAFSAADASHAETYAANAAAYNAQLAALDQEIVTIFAAVPADQRILVTNHDFLGYLAAHYDFQIVGTVIPSLSTLAEPSPQDVADLINAIHTTGVKAVFAEVSNPNALAKVIAQDAGDVAVVILFSDSLSGPDEAAPTYLDYMRYNAQAIADALAS
ncbi:MAG: zinc ABC transporter substrate-binding protein [Anaerolineae bacterium]|nr:zinc ABC transporter substrate-binding protein [Anaerolineae bacterium]